VTQQAGVLSVLAQLCFEEKSAVYPWFLVTIVCLLFATHNFTVLFTLDMPRTFLCISLEDFLSCRGWHNFRTFTAFSFNKQTIMT
jgi:hypothetical protein